MDPVTVWAILSIACRADGICEPTLQPVPMLTHQEAEWYAQGMQKQGQKAVVIKYGTFKGNRFYRPGEDDGK